jgi:hypothetical protein
MYRINYQKKFLDREEWAVEFRETWDEILLDAIGMVFMGIYLILISLIAAPLFAAYAAYDQWKRGGVRCKENDSETERDHGTDNGRQSG